MEENLERVKEKMREFFFKAANRLERCNEDEHGKVIKHLESMIKDFKDSKITSDLKPLSAISTVSAEVTLNTMLKYEMELVEVFIDIVGAIGLEYFLSKRGAVGAVTGLFRKVTGRTEWAMIERGLDAVTVFVGYIGSYEGEHGQRYGM